MFDLQAVERLVDPDGPVPRRARYANIQVRVPYRILRQFRKILPMRGALSWYVRNALEEFAHQGGDITDEEHIHFIRGRVEKLLKKPKKASSPLKW